MSREDEKRVELLTHARLGILACLRSTRGANMFGSGAHVRAVDKSTLEIKTRDAVGPIYWELKLTKKV